MIENPIPVNFPLLLLWTYLCLYPVIYTCPVHLFGRLHNLDNCHTCILVSYAFIIRYGQSLIVHWATSFRLAGSVLVSLIIPHCLVIRFLRGKIISLPEPPHSTVTVIRHLLFVYQLISCLEDLPWTYAYRPSCGCFWRLLATKLL